jgi:long-subunit acyl-CoA synthetase (AMP-forming)
MASNSDLTKFLAQVRAIKPTFFLGMSHLWCECYAVYKRELEVATVQAISRNLKIRGAFIQQYESIQDVDILDELSHTLVHTSFAASPHGGIPAPSTSPRDPEGVDQTAIRFDVCLTAARALKGWDSFVDSMAKLLGIKDMLLLDWYDRFGGRVFIPVTGGGHTSDEVLAWMNAVFMPPTSTLKDQSSRVKNAYG